MSTLAGSGNLATTDGTGTAASFSLPKNVAVSPDGTTALVSEQGGPRPLRSINLATSEYTYACTCACLCTLCKRLVLAHREQSRSLPTTQAR